MNVSQIHLQSLHRVRTLGPGKPVWGVGCQGPSDTCPQAYVEGCAPVRPGVEPQSHRYHPRGPRAASLQPGRPHPGLATTDPSAFSRTPQKRTHSACRLPSLLFPRRILRLVLLCALLLTACCMHVPVTPSPVGVHGGAFQSGADASGRGLSWRHFPFSWINT